MKFQPSFDFGYINDEPAPPNIPPPSAIFIAYLKAVAPDLLNSSHPPIHKTATGYATNSSPHSHLGYFEFDLERKVMIHRHTTPVYVGNKYEYPVVSDRYEVLFEDGRMTVR